jgi:hypothetical protein
MPAVGNSKTCFAANVARTLRVLAPAPGLRHLVIGVFLGGMALTPPVGANSPEKTDSSLPALQSLSIEPQQIRLHGSNRQQQLLITGMTPAGALVDVTDLCDLVSSDPTIVKVAGSRVHGLRDGKATITARLGKLTALVSINVADFATYPPVYFANDVMPIFSKYGCNGGGCHGKASGQNGFKLSVFGFDPEADYNSLVKEARGRRVFPAAARRRTPH